MNKPTKPDRAGTRPLTLSDLRAVVGGEAALSSITKKIQETANTTIQNIRG